MNTCKGSTLFPFKICRVKQNTVKYSFLLPTKKLSKRFRRNQIDSCLHKSITVKE